MWILLKCSASWISLYDTTWKCCPLIQCLPLLDKLKTVTIISMSSSNILEYKYIYIKKSSNEMVKYVSIVYRAIYIYLKPISLLLVYSPTNNQTLAILVKRNGLKQPFPQGIKVIYSPTNNQTMAIFVSGQTLGVR